MDEVTKMRDELKGEEDAGDDTKGGRLTRDSLLEFSLSKWDRKPVGVRNFQRLELDLETVDGEGLGRIRAESSRVEEVLRKFRVKAFDQGLYD